MSTTPFPWPLPCLNTFVNNISYIDAFWQRDPSIPALSNYFPIIKGVGAEQAFDAAFNDKTVQANLFDGLAEFMGRMRGESDEAQVALRRCRQLLERPAREEMTTAMVL